MVFLRPLDAPAQPVHRWSVETHAASLTLKPAVLSSAQPTQPPT